MRFFCGANYRNLSFPRAIFRFGVVGTPHRTDHVAQLQRIANGAHMCYVVCVANGRTAMVGAAFDNVPTMLYV